MHFYNLFLIFSKEKRDNSHHQSLNYFRNINATKCFLITTATQKEFVKSNRTS